MTKEMDKVMTKIPCEPDIQDYVNAETSHRFRIVTNVSAPLFHPTIKTSKTVKATLLRCIVCGKEKWAVPKK